MNRLSQLALFALVGLLPFSVSGQDSVTGSETASTQATSLLGQPLISRPPSDELLGRFQVHEANYKAAPDNPDNLIWYARFLAYTGDYLGAIDVFSKGVDQFPDDPRMLRHRGHRYITLRQFDKALADFDRAVKLIKDQPNQTEPDGMPNAQNIPVSTLQGNIWYHKGLAHYLQNDLEAALTAFRNCLELRTNDDNTVSATHWIYMILRRLGRQDAARNSLAEINTEMNIIENFSYHRACLFYKDEIADEQVLDTKSQNPPTPSDDSLRYAVGNWYLYNHNPDKAREIFDQLIAGGTWASFGHIAAEADMARMQAAQQSSRSGNR